VLSAERLNLMRQRTYIPVTQFSGMIHSATSSKPTFSVQASGAIGTDMGIGLSADSASATVEGAVGITAERILTTTSPVGTPTITLTSGSAGVVGGLGKLTEIGTTGIVGLAMTVAGDDIRHSMPIPSNWDRHCPIRCRVIWATEAADTDTATWKVLYSALTLDSGVIITPATGLDTVLVADAAIGVAKTIQATPWGVINEDKITDANEIFNFLVELDAATITIVSETTYLLGIEWEYTPKLSPNENLARREAQPWEA
jgi:hypothetical protein